MFVQDWDLGSHEFWLDSGTPWAFSFFTMKYNKNSTS